MNLLKKHINKKDNRGFTIIEVVLVLAIAGLILLVVFLALPQLQRSQRDTRRISDLGMFEAALNTYASRNIGAFPGSQAEVTDFCDNYLRANGDLFNDPLSGPYDCNFSSGIAQAKGDINYMNEASCNTDNTFKALPGSKSRIAISIYQESGDICRDNS